MTVIPFPQRTPAPAPDHGEAQPLIEVVAALLSLGEPATCREIDDLLGASFDHGAHQSSAETLFDSYGVDGPSRVFGKAMFRPVTLGPETGWAFTPEFRLHLRRSGFTPRLRPRM